MTATLTASPETDLVKQLERALARRTVARRALVEALLLLEVAERASPASAGDLRARCAAEAEALLDAERDVLRITRA